MPPEDPPLVINYVVHHVIHTEPVSKTVYLMPIVSFEVRAESLLVHPIHYCIEGRRSNVMHLNSSLLRLARATCLTFLEVWRALLQDAFVDAVHPLGGAFTDLHQHNCRCQVDTACEHV